VALLGGNLQAAFDNEPAQDRAAIECARDMRTLIDSEEFRKNGSRVASLACTKNICRGELESQTAEADMKSTEAAFLSMEFAKKFPMAIAIPERTKDAAGSVRFAILQVRSARSRRNSELNSARRGRAR